MSEQRKCSGCAHWTAPSSTYEVVAGAGACNKSIPLEEAVCLRDGGRPSRVEDAEDLCIAGEWGAQMLFVDDGYDMRGFMHTRADFYCAHHEPRTKTATIQAVGK